jgi:hypothetical protein
MRKPALLAVALSFLALFFGWETWRAWRAPLPASDNGARAPGALWQPGAAVPDPAPPPETGSLLAAIAARPLFRSDRKPSGEGGVSSRAYEQELSRFSLIGILVIGDDQKGLVVSKGGPRTDRWEVKAGESLPGFTVKEVRTDGLALAADGREFLLPLYAGAPTATGGAIRTDVQRRDGAPAPNPAASPTTSASPSRPAPAPAQPSPAVQGVPQPTPGAPVAAPRTIRGRR